MRRWQAPVAAVLLALMGCGAGPIPAQAADLPRALTPAELQSGLGVASADIRQLAADDGANPAFLWVEQGRALWNTAPAAGTRSCAACHGPAEQSMKGVAARHPRWDAQQQSLVNLEGRINACRTERQQSAAWAYESDALLGLTAYLALQSRGQRSTLGTDEAWREPAALAALKRGEQHHVQRTGHLGLACLHCHDRHWGRRLGPETVSQGHALAYPAYRFEWQRMGSLHRRLRACYAGLRAEMPAPGSLQLIELEAYLHWRAAGLPLEAPGVRR